MLVRVFLFVTLAVAAAMADAKDDVVCFDVTPVIEKQVFSQLREYFVNTLSDYGKLSTYEFSLLGYGAGIVAGRVGQLSKFSLDVLPGENSTALCLDQGQEIVNLNVAFDELDLIFEDFFIHFPLINIGDTKTTFSLKGVKIFSQVQLFKDEKGKTCQTAKLVNFKFRDFGSMNIAFENGLLNKLYAYILNYFSDDIVSSLKYLGIGRWVGSDAQVFLEPIVRKQEANFCSLETQM